MKKHSRAVHLQFTRRGHSGGMKLLRFFLWLALAGVSWAAEGDGAFVVDAAQSRIEIDVRATVGSFVARLANYDLELTLGPDGRQVERAVLNFKFADVQTGEAKRDRHMHDWQETERFPDGRFELVRLLPGEGGRYVAEGRLTLHGQTHAVSFPVSMLTEGRTVALNGEVPVDTQAYGLPIIRKFVALKVNPVVTVRFQVQGTVSAGI